MKDNNRMPEENSFYQTGSTRPPKSYRGLVAVLLVLVIFLGGIVSALGLMNIHLFRQLQKQNETETSFRFGEKPPAATDTAEDAQRLTALGLSVQSVPALHQHYYHLPQGLYVTSISSGSDAQRKGIRHGDILTQLDGMAVTDAADTAAFLALCQPGQSVSVVVYRDGTSHTLSIVLE